MDRRVVITGMGAITPIGNNVNDFWQEIKKGSCGIEEIKNFDTTDFKVKFAAEVKDFVPDEHIDRKEAKRMDRFCQLAMVAAKEAIENSKINLDLINKDRVGVIVSSGIGGLATIEEQAIRLRDRGPSKVSPFFIPMSIINMAAGNIAIKYGLKGVSGSIVTACASSTDSIGYSFKCIKDGLNDIILAGGSEASISPLGIAGFTSLNALSKNNDKNRLSIPFDKERDGFVMGEGSGILVLEELNHALKRNAKIYGEIVGYGSTCDGYHITSPNPDASGAIKAMKIALNDAKINCDDVSYINAHGTSTVINDKIETLAIKKLFGKKAYDIPISSTKSMTGHLLGAAGAIESIVCIKSLQEGFVPPTKGYKVKDEECDLDYVPNKGRNANLNYAMSNSLGFGGHNGVVLFKKWIER